VRGRSKEAESCGLCEARDKEGVSKPRLNPRQKLYIQWKRRHRGLYVEYHTCVKTVAPSLLVALARVLRSFKSRSAHEPSNDGMLLSCEGSAIAFFLPYMTCMREFVHAPPAPAVPTSAGSSKYFEMFWRYGKSKRESRCCRCARRSGRRTSKVRAAGSRQTRLRVRGCLLVPAARDHDHPALAQLVLRAQQPCKEARLHFGLPQCRRRGCPGRVRCHPGRERGVRLVDAQGDPRSRGQKEPRNWRAPAP